MAQMPRAHGSAAAEGLGKAPFFAARRCFGEDPRAVLALVEAPWVAEDHADGALGVCDCWGAAEKNE